MPEKHLFEYAIIRIVPCVEREEFMNVGVIMYCSAQKFLKCTTHIDIEKLKSFRSHLSINELQERLDVFKKICGGIPDGGTIGTYPLASRFRWLTATRSTVVQTSKVHPGLCQDAAKTLLRLHEDLVL